MSPPNRTEPKPIAASPADPFAEWYVAWCAGRDDERAAEEARRERNNVNWLVAVLVGWSLVAAAAGGVALALWTAS